MPGIYLTEEERLRGRRRKNRRWKIKGKYDEDIKEKNEKEERKIKSERITVKQSLYRPGQRMSVPGG